MVRTTTDRPHSAARSASAAAIVVLPTPPAPQHTTTRVARSPSSSSMFSGGGGLVLIAGGSPDPLLAQHLGKLVNSPEIDAIAPDFGEIRQLDQRHPGVGESGASVLLGVHSHRMLDGFGHQAVDYTLPDMQTSGE